jgi:hypothetical protein
VEYECKTQSQNEFVLHFGIPATDPRHSDYTGGAVQQGVYNAAMFARPSAIGNGNGIHVIMLDARTGRDPTFGSAAQCRYGHSHVLNETQWGWLDAELGKHSEIKIIGSGTQVLPPTDLVSNRPYAMLCYAMLCYAMLCYAMLCYAVLCVAMLCYAML